MAYFRNALFLVAFVVVVVGVNSAAFQQSDYNQRPSVWSAKMSPLERFSFWRKDENTFRVDSVKGCCLPQVWSGTVFGLGETYAKEEEGRQETHRIKYVMNIDLANKRIAQDVTVDNVTQSNIILCDKSGATIYSFVKATQQCKKEQFSQCPIDPRDMCFPSNGSLVESFHLGAGSGALSTQTWGYQHRDSGVETVADVILNPDNCVPVLIATKTHTYDSDKLLYASGYLFTNVTLSNPDPSVFTPPPYCRKGETPTFDRQDFDITAIFKKIALFR